MKLSKLIEELQSVANNYSSDLECVIPISLNHLTMGPRPKVGINSVMAGIDWDSGSLFIFPQTKLTLFNYEAKNTKRNS